MKVALGKPKRSEAASSVAIWGKALQAHTARSKVLWQERAWHFKEQRKQEDSMGVVTKGPSAIARTAASSWTNMKPLCRGKLEHYWVLASVLLPVSSMTKLF